MTHHGPSATHGWRRLLALFTIASFVEAAFYGQVTALTPLYLPYLGIPPDQVRVWTGYIVSISAAVGIPFLPLWGALADRYSRKPVIIRSYIAHLAAALSMLLAPNILIFALGRAISGFSLGNSGLMMTTLTERTPRERTGFAFSVMNGASPLGVLIGPLLGGLALDRWGFRTLLLVDAALILGVIVMLSLGYHDQFRGTSKEPILHMAADSVLIIWSSPLLRLLFPALFLLLAGRALAGSYVPLAVTTLYQGPTPGTAVGLASAAAGLATLIISPLMGILADRTGHWRVLFAGSALSVALWPLPAFAASLESFIVVWAILSGVVSGVFALSFSVLSSSSPPGGRARVMSFSYLPVIAGSAVAPALGALITTQSVFAVFPAAALLTALGIGALALAAQARPPQPVSES